MTTNIKTISAKQITTYLLENPTIIDRNEQHPYTEVAKKFGVSNEYIRQIWKRLRKKGLVEKDAIINKAVDDVISEYVETGNSARFTSIVNKEIKSLEDLIETCNIDTNVWEVSKWSVKSYNGYSKADGELSKDVRYSVNAELKRKTVDTDLNKQKEAILELLKKEAPVVAKYEDKEFSKKSHLFEISLPDVHFGKLSWAGESGEDYDLKIATERFKSAVKGLLQNVPLHIIDRILFPIGNDMINVDSRRNMTTAGTPQDSDSRFRKLLLTVNNLLIETISELSTIAPVDVVVVSGNHDYDTMFNIGMVLEAYFHNNENVTIDNSPKQRKYYRYGKTAIMFTHGNEEKHSDLGLIFATEQPVLWAQTYFREAQLGHFHKNKKTNYISVDEYQGFQINILPSLSATDYWHNSKGYMGLKQGKAFLYEKEDGKVAEFNYTVKQN